MISEQWSIWHIGIHINNGRNVMSKESDWWFIYRTQPFVISTTQGKHQSDHKTIMMVRSTSELAYSECPFLCALLLPICHDQYTTHLNGFKECLFVPVLGLLASLSLLSVRSIQNPLLRLDTFFSCTMLFQ